MADEPSRLGREAMTHILRQLNQRPIAYYGAYADLMGSVPGGVYLSQILYWWSVSGDEFYKTDAELMSETRLSAREIRSAKYTLKKLECITVKAKGSPPVTHYTVDSEKFFQKLASLANLVKMTKSEPNVVSQFGQNDKIQFGQNDKIQFGQNDKILIKECACVGDLKTEITKTETTEDPPLVPQGDDSPTSPPKYSQAFEDFWQAYPDKTRKAAAWKNWQRQKLTPLLDTILADIAARLTSFRKWQEGFIQNPTTYLAGRMWEDGWQDAPQPVRATNGHHPGTPTLSPEESKRRRREKSRALALANGEPYGDEDSPPLQRPREDVCL